MSVLVAISAVAFLSGEREPEYNGKKLSEWLALQRERPDDVTDAVRAIGTNALPVLVKWVEYQVPAWHLKLLRLYQRVPLLPFKSSIANDIANAKDQMRGYNSAFAFRVLGADASTTVP